MTVIFSINKESVVYENIIEFELVNGVYSLIPENGEGFSIPFENTQGFKAIADGAQGQPQSLSK